MQASGAYISVDHELATEDCLSHCPEDLKTCNNRYAESCLGAHRVFKQQMAERCDPPITRGYRYHRLSRAQSLETYRRKKFIGLYALSGHCNDFRSIVSCSPNGFHMMIRGNKEEPVISTSTTAVLINVRIPVDKTKRQRCCGSG